MNKIVNDESDEDFMFVTGESLTNQTSFIARFSKDDLTIDWIIELDIKELNDFSSSQNIEEQWLGCGLSQTNQAIFFSINLSGELVFSFDLGDSNFKNSSCYGLVSVNDKNSSSSYLFEAETSNGENLAIILQFDEINQ